MRVESIGADGHGPLEAAASSLGLEPRVTTRRRPWAGRRNAFGMGAKKTFGVGGRDTFGVACSGGRLFGGRGRRGVSHREKRHPSIPPWQGGRPERPPVSGEAGAVHSRKWGSEDHALALVARTDGCEKGFSRQRHPLLTEQWHTAGAPSLVGCGSRFKEFVGTRRNRYSVGERRFGWRRRLTLEPFSFSCSRRTPLPPPLVRGEASAMPPA